MKLEERVLILAPLGDDAQNAANVLSQSNIFGEICFNLEELNQKFLKGAGALIITEESLTHLETMTFIDSLKGQEKWSDIPIIIITSGGETTALSVSMINLFSGVGNINLLERPLRKITLTSAAQVALRTRQRQFQMKDLLEAHKKAEQEIIHYANELLEANKGMELLASIVSSSDDAIISKNLEGIIISWNIGAERIFGYKAHEVIGKPIHILFPKDRFNEEPVFLERIKKGERIDHYDTVRQCKDGRLVDISLTISPIRDDKGVIIGASKIARDVTQRKKQEKELRSLTFHLEQRVEERTHLLEEQAERLRQLAVELTEVEQKERRRLAEVLHDHLQQYLVAAKMRLEMVERKAIKVDKGGLEDARLYIENAIESSRVLTAELRPPVLYEGGLTAGLRYLGQKMQDQHKLRVHLSFLEDIEPGSELIKVMVYQCVQELLFNAVKYANVNEIFVTATRLEKNHIQVKVEDHGVGFNVKSLGNNTTGGFGLFSIRERIKALGGEFKISSIPQEGSVFTLIVPDRIPVPVIGKIDFNEEKLFMRERVHKEGIVVLVADDHLIVRQSIASLLMSQTFIKEVIEAGNGEEAIRKAESSDPDIILMDVNMPIMNGIEATRVLSNRKSRSKVIGLSVQAKSEMAQAMKDAGAVAYFNKGDNTTSLIDAIRDLAYPQLPSSNN